MSEVAAELCRKIDLHIAAARQSGKPAIVERLVAVKQQIEERERERDVAATAAEDARGVDDAQ